jgi:hypothetical protein
MGLLFCHRRDTLLSVNDQAGSMLADYKVGVRPQPLGIYAESQTDATFLEDAQMFF